jgi:hypothetical protein
MDCIFERVARRARHVHCAPLAACLPVVLLLASRALANGHGPVYGLATPTLSEGGWAVDVGAMDRLAGTRSQDLNLRPMVSYGLTSDVQLSASVPLPLYSRGTLDPVRMMALMPAAPDVEMLLGWRFHRQAPAVGARFESTLYAGVDYPVEASPPGIAPAPAVVGALVTGYASRSIYAWIGGLYRRSLTALEADHPGDQIMASLVLGYRPPFLARDAPAADWRIFLEGVGEYTLGDQGQGQLAGRTVPNTGGTEVLVGPTVLGLFGAWGISGGPLFPVYSALNGNQPTERVRLALIFTYWWF